MENISTVLIATVTMVIVVLLISISVFVINSSKGVQEENEKKVNSTEVWSFNEKFQIYEGEAVSASKVRSLIQLVKANNAQEEDKYINLTGNATSTDKLNTSSLYLVQITKYNELGYVSEIKIKEN